MADYIDEIIEREGKETDDPDDSGGRTKFGISAAGNPDLWNPGPPTYEQARARYLQRYVRKPGFHRITFRPLREQLVDFGVTSGPQRVIRLLQALLGTDQDGVLGPATLAALATRDAHEVNNLLVAAREQFYHHLVAVRPTNKKFLRGWLTRARLFLLP